MAVFDTGIRGGEGGAVGNVSPEGELYWHHGTCSQTFRKYYNRYLQSDDEASPSHG